MDTHVILWWLTDDAALSDEMKTRLDDEPGLYVSPASLWEVTIRQSIGKLSEPIDLAEETGNSGFRELPITFRHAIVAGRLPLIHRDPFDRMLVAQAHCEAMTLSQSRPAHPAIRCRPAPGVTSAGVALTSRPSGAPRTFDQPGEPVQRRLKLLGRRCPGSRQPLLVGQPAPVVRVRDARS